MTVNASSKFRALVFVLFGLVALTIGFYATRQTMLYRRSFDDPVGTAVFALGAVALYFLAAANLYIAAGYRFGHLVEVAGTLDAATLRATSGVVAESVRIRWVRRPDADDPTVMLEDRYVFFISSWRPWVCLATAFLAR